MTTPGKKNVFGAQSFSRKQVPRSESEKSTPVNLESSFSKHEGSGSSSKRKERRWDAKPEDSDAPLASNEVVKRRKTRWSSDDAQLKRMGPLQLPDFQGLDERQPDFEVQELNRQLMEINKKLQDIENGGSSGLVYNKLELIKQKQQVVSKLVEKTLGLKSLPDDKHGTLYKKLYIPEKQYPEYNFIGLIIGPRGSTLKRMESETGAKILLRGKGSVKEDKYVKNNKTIDPSEDEDLHVRIEANNQKSLDAAVEMVEKLLVPVEDGSNDLKRQQLFELAVLSGKVAVSCNICGENTHSTRFCPLIASAPNTAQRNDSLSGIGAGVFSSSAGVPVPNNASPRPGTIAGTSKVNGTDEANLFVGYLPQFIDEVRLKQLFDPFGAIRKVKVVRDPATGVSKGCGFVKFCDPANATIAIEKMHKFKIGDKTLAVQVAGLPPRNTGGPPSPTPTYPGSPPNLQVMSTPTISPAFLPHSGYFTTTSLSFHPSVPGYSPAVAPVPHMSRADHPPVVGQSPSEPGVSASSIASPGLGTLIGTSKARVMDEANLFVGFLPDTIDEVSLKQLFDPFGTIIGVMIHRDPDTGASKGYGFVRYSDPASAAIAIEKMHKFKIENKILAVRVAGQFETKGMDETKLFVGFLPHTIDEVSLKQLFDPFGTITGVMIPRDPGTGASKGYGFVRYSDPASAAIAIEKMHEFKLGNKTLAVRVAGCPPKTGGSSASVPPPYPCPPANSQVTSTPMVWPALPEYSGYFTTSVPLVQPSVPGCSPLAAVAPAMSLAAHPSVPGCSLSDAHVFSNVSPGFGTSAGSSNAKGLDEAKLYVGYLPHTIDEVGLKQLFDPFGTVIEATVLRHPETGASKGYGFVRYSDPASAAIAIEKMHEFKIGNKTLAVRVAGLSPTPGSLASGTPACGYPANPQATSASTVWPASPQFAGHFTPTVPSLHPSLPGRSIPAELVPPVSLAAHPSFPGRLASGQPMSLAADYPTFPGCSQLSTPAQPMSVDAVHSLYSGLSSLTTPANPTAQPMSLLAESAVDIASFARNTGYASGASSMYPSASITSSSPSGVNFPGSLFKDLGNPQIHPPHASASLFHSPAIPRSTTNSNGPESFPGNPDYFRSKIL